ncbi:MAG: 3-hydroxyacyl-CoA dehydrogenase family protein [Candidatus Dormibacteria bacterium]
MSPVPGRLLVLGAGTMGSQIAQQAALCGVEVALVDSDGGQLRRAAESNRGHLERRVAKDKLTAEAAESALARVSYSPDLGVAATCSWAIEAILEDETAKRRALAELDEQLPPEAGIATNSSNIGISRIAGATGRPQLCCNMHFFHPVLVVDLCEVMGGPDTASQTLDRAVAWAERIRRRPVRIRGELDGLVVNRVLGAASAEGFALLADGVAEADAIDTAARGGLGWPMGPFQLADFSGVDVIRHVRADRHGRTGDPRDAAAVQVLDRLIAAGRLGRKSGRGFYAYDTDPARPLPLPD